MEFPNFFLRNLTLLKCLSNSTSQPWNSSEISPISQFRSMCNKLTNIELAVVSSMVKLESQHLAQITKQVQKLTRAKNVRIKKVIDPCLVVGFTMRYGNSRSNLINTRVNKQAEEIVAQLDLGDIQRFVIEN